MVTKKIKTKRKLKSMEKKSTIISKALTELAETIATAMVELSNSIATRVETIRNEKTLLREDCNEFAQINNAVGEFVEEMDGALGYAETIVDETDEYLDTLEHLDMELDLEARGYQLEDYFDNRDEEDEGVEVEDTDEDDED